MTRHVGGNLQAGVLSAQSFSTAQNLSGYSEHVYTTDDDPPVETNAIRSWRDWAGLRNGQTTLRLSNHRAPRVHALGWALDPDNVWRPLRVDASGALLVNTGPAPEPGPLTAQLAAWYRASDLAQPDGSSVVAWPDTSGSGATLLQTTGLLAPTLVAGALGGQAVVRFDGNAQLNRSFPPGYQAGDAAWSLYVVCTPNPPYNPCHLFGWGNSAATDGRVMLTLNKFGGIWGWQVDTQGGTSRAYQAALVPQIVSADNAAGANITAASLYINGAVGTLLDPGAGGPLNVPSPVFDVRTGNPNNSADRWRGDIAEILYYHKRHNASERAQVLTYLSARYAIPVTP